MPPPIRFKCPVVGSNGVGKTNLVICFADRDFAYPYGRVPTQIEPWVEDMTAGDLQYELEIVDNYGNEEDPYDRLRAIYFQGADIFFVCFSVDSHTSYQKVLHVWIPEIRHHCPDADVVLVGTQTDKREDAEAKAKLAEEELQCLTKEDGERLAKEIGAAKYVECSTQKPDELRADLHEALNTVLEPSRPRKSRRYKQPGWPWYWCCWVVCAGCWHMVTSPFTKKEKRGRVSQADAS